MYFHTETNSFLFKYRSAKTSMIYPSCGSLKEFSAAIQSDIENKKKPKKKPLQATKTDLAAPEDSPTRLGIDVSSTEARNEDPIVKAIDSVLSHSKYQAGSNEMCRDVYFRRAEIHDAADIRRCCVAAAYLKIVMFT